MIAIPVTASRRSPEAVGFTCRLSRRYISVAYGTYDRHYYDRKAQPMADAPRPPRRPRIERIRVEMRLHPDTAERFYQWAADHNAGVSEAANQLLEFAIKHYQPPRAAQIDVQA